MHRSGCDSGLDGLAEATLCQAEVVALPVSCRKGADPVRSGVKRRVTSGFTLIEVLISVVVLSTGLVLVLQGLHAVLYSWDGGVRRMREWMEAQEAIATVRLAARQGVPPVADGPIRVASGVGGRDGLFQIVYEGQPDERGHRFALDSLLYLPPAREEPLP